MPALWRSDLRTYRMVGHFPATFDVFMYVRSADDANSHHGRDGHPMTQSELQQIASALAEGMGLDPALVQAICETESSWEPWAARYEPGFYARYVEPMTGISDTEKSLRSTSFGLMQVMGQVAREQGFKGKYLTELCDPIEGVTQGCKKLKACLNKTGGDVTAALLKYNGGGDKEYPNRVLSKYDKYKKGS